MLAYANRHDQIEHAGNQGIGADQQDQRDNGQARIQRGYHAGPDTEGTDQQVPPPAIIARAVAHGAEGPHGPGEQRKRDKQRCQRRQCDGRQQYGWRTESDSKGAAQGRLPPGAHNVWPMTCPSPQ